MFQKYFVALLAMVFLCLSTLGAQTDKKYGRQIKKHRKEYKLDFLKNPNSPLDRKGVKQLDFFDTDPAYRISAKFEPAEEPEPFEMATYAGTTQPYIPYGRLHFELSGKKHELTLYRSLRNMPGYQDYLFLPFKDLTNGSSTYGGGRYLDFRTGDIKDFELKLDFNKAYNPYCAYSDGYQCPIPPVENHLNIALPAGEKAYEEKH